MKEPLFDIATDRLMIPEVRFKMDSLFQMLGVRRGGYEMDSYCKNWTKPGIGRDVEVRVGVRNFGLGSMVV